MNFYTLISKSTKNPKQWIRLVGLTSLLISLFIISFNYIVDPYNITNQNILNIKYKFARDDRTEKAYYFKTQQRVDNILIGSSRVYSINPQVVTNIIGGTTYNFGVGTATVEDQLGIIKFLQKENKLPKNIVLGVDFYTFNKDIPPNKYFLRNKELNFLSYSNYQEDYISKLFSIDSFRASYKTLKNHIFKTNQRPRFDIHGWAGVYENYKKTDTTDNTMKVKQEIIDTLPLFYSNLNYQHLDSTRVTYYEEIRKICSDNNITLYLFTTPLHPMLLQTLRESSNTLNALEELISYLNTFKNFTNLYDNEEIYRDLRNFHGATHTSPNAGDIILNKVLNQNKL